MHLELLETTWKQKKKKSWHQCIYMYSNSKIWWEMLWWHNVAIWQHTKNIAATSHKDILSVIFICYVPWISVPLLKKHRSSSLEKFQFSLSNPFIIGLKQPPLHYVAIWQHSRERCQMATKIYNDKFNPFYIFLPFGNTLKSYHK